MKKTAFVSIIYILMLLISFPFKVNAAYQCTDADAERLQKLASNVSYVVEEVDNGNNVRYKITFSGMSDELSIFDNYNLCFKYYVSLNDLFFGEVDIGNLLPGKTYSFDIKGSKKCTIGTLRKIIVNTPEWNNYYNTPICSDVKSFQLCLKHSSTNLSYEDFAKKVEEYKLSIKDNNKGDNELEDDKIEKILEYYEKYYKPFFTLTMCMLILLIVLVVRKNKKNKL